MSLIPKMHIKKQGMVISNHSPSAGVVGTGGSLELDHLIGEFQVIKSTQVNKVKASEEQQIVLWPPNK